MKALFLSLLISISCTKYATFEKSAVGTTIEPVSMEISHLNEIEWRVGPDKDELTQSVSFIVDLPKLKSDDLSFLSEQKSIDSWLLRVIALQNSKEQDIGSMYVLFKPAFAGRGASIGSTSSVSIRLVYASAFISERFRQFKCPAFAHNKKIDTMKILGANDDFSIQLKGAINYNDKAQMVGLRPTDFNAGHSLVGEYFIEIAAFDSKKKTILSSFKRIPMSVSIRSEEIISVKGCEGVHPELQ
jgi:hypothetical protein